MQNSSFRYIDIAYSAEAAPEDHNADWPILLPLGRGEWIHTDKTFPFAAIIALSPGEKVAVKARPAIFFSVENGKVSQRNGSFAARNKYPLIQCKVAFPKLLAKLRKVNKGMEAVLHTKGGEKPWMHVKNWHEGDREIDIQTSPFNASLALQAFESWASWEERKLDWGERMHETEYRRNTDTLTSLVSAENYFQKFCNELGLHRGEMADFTEHFAAIHEALDLAMEVFRRS